MRHRQRRRVVQNAVDAQPQTIAIASRFDLNVRCAFTVCIKDERVGEIWRIVRAHSSASLRNSARRLRTKSVRSSVFFVRLAAPDSISASLAPLSTQGAATSTPPLPIDGQFLLHPCHLQTLLSLRIGKTASPNPAAMPVRSVSSPRSKT